MSWLWSTSAIDELIDKATSENLPAGTDDLALNLEICDQVRSKQVSPKDVAKALKRRIAHKNPNVQLLALGLTDVCVKNGGQHFLVEIASRDFVDHLTSAMKAPNCNLEVRNKILMLVQTWGKLFRGKPGLGYVCDTYLILQREGYPFPPSDNVGAALVETQAPPDWTDSDVCTRCRATFTLTNRKHHCRACGSTYCGQCSSKTMSLPNLGVTQEVRVCDGCWMKKKLGNNSAILQDTFGLGGPAELVPSVSKSTPATTTAAPSSSTTTAENDDEDLRKAIELSLKESNSRPGYSAKQPEREPVQNTTGGHVEDDDADLLAAIEASLRETNLNQQSSNAGQDQRQSPYAAYSYSSQIETAGAPAANDLTKTEKENIEMFSSLVDRIQMMNGDVAGNREVQALYEQISKLQTKVSVSLEEAAKKQQDVMEFNDKIDQAVRMYDHLLQERLNSTYQRRMNANSYGHPGVQQQHTGGSPALSASMSAQAPSNSHVYPHLTGSDPRYTPYAPGAPLPQQPPAPPAPFAPHMPQLQSSQQYQPPYSDYTPSSFATAPPISQPIAAHESLAPQAPFQANQSGQDPYHASAPAAQSPFAPYNIPQQQQQQHQQHIPMQYQSPPPLQTYAPAAPVAPVAVPVEEKPLIEF
ncbi:Vacuolar protein-sorting-associated protein 27 [Mortierella alpina]|uniref:Vacuolar protein sorting-associated protein 27 n=1 Tax=Mortierella alpina TaxID=64518 RepID=A0A9P6JCR5_MORAP|nr:Vacuolar protein-sorting-associated protein 27 [Mortierella alpina]